MGHWFGAFAQAGEDVPDEVQALEIKSETTLCSADFYIAKEQGKDVDEKTDKERKKLGMGEDVLLTLTGKPMGMFLSCSGRLPKEKLLPLFPKKRKERRRWY